MTTPAPLYKGRPPIEGANTGKLFGKIHNIRVPADCLPEVYTVIADYKQRRIIEHEQALLDNPPLAFNAKRAARQFKQLRSLDKATAMLQTLTRDQLYDICVELDLIEGDKYVKKNDLKQKIMDTK
jgi:hypothetical protein